MKCNTHNYKNIKNRQKQIHFPNNEPLNNFSANVGPNWPILIFKEILEEKILLRTFHHSHTTDKTYNKDLIFIRIRNLILIVIIPTRNKDVLVLNKVTIKVKNIILISQDQRRFKSQVPKTFSNSTKPEYIKNKLYTQDFHHPANEFNEYSMKRDDYNSFPLIYNKNYD